MKQDIECYYEDMDLIQRILQKDQHALETLYKKYCRRLVCFIKAFSVTYDDSQDILQNTFISALDSLEGFRGNSQFFTWLCTIARRKTADYYRARRQSVESWEDLKERGKLGTAAAEKSNSVEDWVFARESCDKVRNIIRIMPAHYQDILVQKYLLNKTIKEYAAQNAMTEKAAESLNTRAKKYLKRLLEENGYFSGGDVFE